MRKEGSNALNAVFYQSRSSWRGLICRMILAGALIMAQTCNAKECRNSIHAGTWYPGKEKDLREEIAGYLKNARSTVAGEIYGLVSPHAAYMYSGPVAAFSYKQVENKSYDLVVVIGPSHQYGFHGASVDTMQGRKTPLGTIEYDLETARKLLKAGKLITYEPMAHEQEHSVEIQMPFLQVVLKKFKTVEIVMGTQDHETCESLASAIVKAAKGKKTLLVASSDLSHYHDQTTAEKLDGLVLDAVKKYDPELLGRRLSQDSCEACGGGPIITVMMAAREMGATTAGILNYGTSGNTSGDYSQVVGYLSAALYTGNSGKHEVGVDLGFSEDEKAKLKEIAGKSIKAAVQGEENPGFEGISEKLKEPYGVFVTINKHGSLRGCIGHIIADQPLYQVCAEMARAAALSDPRFDPVARDELKDLEIEISVLTPFEPVKDLKKIVIGRDGLIIKRGYYSGLLLPQVATDYGWTVEEFLEHTCNKAGLPSDAYKQKGTEVFKFSAEVF
jgi:AmmeMemoRadiSam system protein B/AmmeMemoRadiSam system protein A